jgi:hypothetical protein
MRNTSTQTGEIRCGNGEREECEQQLTREGVLLFLKHNLCLRESDESLDNLMHQIIVDISFSIN